MDVVVTAIPQGKTMATLVSDVHQSFLTEGDEGYIDGYTVAADGRPYAFFVRESDGLIDMVSLHGVVATRYMRHD